jgi:GntR family transcriptional repressor for pyruvate dehydrogenase complex
MDFQPLKPRASAVDACAAAIRNAILSRELAPGDRLPPERKLAGSFGVNRVTVRGALAQLASARLLSVKQGSGYVVRNFEREGGPDLLPGLADLANQSGQLRSIIGDLLLVRRHLARAVLERLAEPTATVDAEPIADAIDAFARAVKSGDAAGVAEADLGVVGAILDATASPVLGLCMNPLLQVVTGMPALREAIYADPQSNLDGWRMLLVWLEHRRAELINTVMAELERRDNRTMNSLQP